MKRSAFLLICAVFLLRLTGSGQSKVIRRTWGTYLVRLPGNIRVGPDGREIPSRDTVLVVYAETTVPGLTWSRAWFNGNSYDIVATRSDSGYIDAGTRPDQAKVIIRCAKGDRLWRLQLLPAARAVGCPVRLLRGEIGVAGIYRHKKFIRRIRSLTELEGPPIP